MTDEYLSGYDARKFYSTLAVLDTVLVQSAKI